MPVTLEMLGGTPAIETVPEVTDTSLTRKKRRDAKPPKRSDNMAWRWNGEGPPIEVVRSPINTDNWVTPHERQCMVSELLSRGWAFAKRRGWRLVPCNEGAEGWLKQNGRGPRRFHVFSGGVWRSERQQFDDGL